MSIILEAKIRLRKDTAANWTANNPILADGEAGIESDTNKFKFGNGSTAWNDLTYASGGGQLTAEELAAVHNATAPTSQNPFATMQDIPSPQLTADELAAVQGANAPNAQNPFATIADVGTGGGGVVGDTYANISTLKSSNQLVPGSMYYITDKGIYLRALTNNTFAKAGIYEYKRGKKAWGAIQVTSATGGNVSAITVNGVNLLTAIINYSLTVQNGYFTSGDFRADYDRSLQKLVENIVANINANGASNYVAYACGSYIVLQAKVVGTASNGFTVSGTATTVTLGNAIAMSGGENDPSIPLLYECNYDFEGDKITRLYDPTYDNEVVDSTGAQIFNFNWNNSSITGWTIKNSTIMPSFVGSTSEMKHWIATDSTVGGNLVAGGAKANHNVVRFANFSANAVVGSSAYLSNCSICGGGSYALSAWRGVANAQFKNNTIIDGSVSSIVINGAARFVDNTINSPATLTDLRFGYDCGFMGNTVTGATIFSGNTFEQRAVMANNIFTSLTFYGNQFSDDVAVCSINWDRGSASYAGMTNTNARWWQTSSSTINRQTWTGVNIGGCEITGTWYDTNAYPPGTVPTLFNTLTGLTLFNFRGKFTAMQGVTQAGNAANSIYINGNMDTGFIDISIRIDMSQGSLGAVGVLKLIGSRYKFLITHAAIHKSTLSGSGEIKIGHDENDSCIMPSTSIASIAFGYTDITSGLTLVPTSAGYKHLTITKTTTSASGVLIIYLRGKVII